MQSQVSIKEVEGNTIGLYFGANWFSKCSHFNQILASIYHQLKEENSKFEIIFVSSDEDQSSFDEFYSTMPWLAIPFSDLNSRKMLTQRFNIEGIPSLIILSPNGELVHHDGVELVYRYGVRAFPFTQERLKVLEGEEKEKHASQTLENLLLCEGRDYVMSHDDDDDKMSCFSLVRHDAKLISPKELQVPISTLIGKTIGLYFSAHSCPPCAKFTSKLIPVYNNLKAQDAEFEIVLVSLDLNPESFEECYKGMPWLALPHDGEFSKSLSRYFDVQGIPTLVIIGPDGKTVTKEGRNLINLYMEMAYPFTEDRLRVIREEMDEEAKSYPRMFRHVGHRHVLNLVSEDSGGGAYICCECNEQGSGWAYQCLGCGYEVHLKCVKEEDEVKKQMVCPEQVCALSN